MNKKVIIITGNPPEPKEEYVIKAGEYTFKEDYQKPTGDFYALNYKHDNISYTGFGIEDGAFKNLYFTGATTVRVYSIDEWLIDNRTIIVEENQTVEQETYEFIKGQTTYVGSIQEKVVVLGSSPLDPLENRATERDLRRGKQAYNDFGSLMNGIFDGVELPSLANPAKAGQVRAGREFIDENGNKLIGEMPIYDGGNKVQFNGVLETAGKTLEYDLLIDVLDKYIPQPTISVAFNTLTINKPELPEGVALLYYKLYINGEYVTNIDSGGEYTIMPDIKTVDISQYISAPGNYSIYVTMYAYWTSSREEPSNKYEINIGSSCVTLQVEIPLGAQCIAATAADGNVVLLGGSTGRVKSDNTTPEDVELYLQFFNPTNSEVGGNTRRVRTYIGSNDPLVTTLSFELEKAYAAHSDNAVYLIGGLQKVSGGVGKMTNSRIYKLDLTNETISVLKNNLNNEVIGWNVFGAASAVKPNKGVGVTVYAFGGESLEGQTATKNKAIHTYNTANYENTNRSDILPYEFTNASAVYFSENDKFYIFGGDVGGGVYSNQIIEFDPTTKIATVKNAVMIDGLIGTSAAVLGSRIYIFGGENIGGTLKTTVQIYDPVNDTLTRHASFSLAEGAAYAAAVTFGGAIYLLGGKRAGDAFSNKIVRFIP